MNNTEFWREVVRTHEVLFRQFASELRSASGEFDKGRYIAYCVAAESLAFVLEDNKELAS